MPCHFVIGLSSRFALALGGHTGCFSGSSRHVVRWCSERWLESSICGMAASSGAASEGAGAGASSDTESARVRPRCRDGRVIRKPSPLTASEPAVRSLVYTYVTAAPIPTPATTARATSLWRPVSCIHARASRRRRRRRWMALMVRCDNHFPSYSYGYLSCLRTVFSEPVPFQPSLKRLLRTWGETLIRYYRRTRDTHTQTTQLTTRYDKHSWCDSDNTAGAARVLRGARLSTSPPPDGPTPQRPSAPDTPCARDASLDTTLQGSQAGAGGRRDNALFPRMGDGARGSNRPCRRCKQRLRRRPYRRAARPRGAV